MMGIPEFAKTWAPVISFVATFSGGFGYWYSNEFKPLVLRTTMERVLSEERTKFEAKIKEVEKYAGDTRTEVKQHRFQTNTLNRSILRNQKFNLEQELETKADLSPGNKNAIRGQLRSVEEELREVDEERKTLIVR